MEIEEAKKEEPTWWEVIMRSLLLVSFLMLLFSVLALTGVVWVSTRPSKGPTYITVFVPMFFVLVPFFAGLTMLFANARVKLERFLAWFSLAIAAAAIAYAIVGMGHG